MFKINRFTFKSFNYGVDHVLDEILIISIKSGILKINQSHYDIEIFFGNGYCMKAWNANKYHAWLNEGEFYLKDKTYQWNGFRPKKSTMSYLLKEMSKFYLN